MEITSENLSKIRESLPTGGQSRISEKLGYSQNYVNMVLNAKVSINDKNMNVILEAYRLIDEHNKKKAELMASINKTQNQA